MPDSDGKTPPDPAGQVEDRPDDAVIGRAFRGSLLFFTAVMLVGLAVYWLVPRRQVDPLPPVAARLPAGRRPPPARPLPRVPFTNITAAAGIDFVHTNGAYGDKLLPETMGGGVAVLDYDDDGDQDLLLINSSRWPWHSTAAGSAAAPPTMALYRNNGSGKFQNETATAGLDVSLYGMGVAVGDVDGDGHVDVLITAVGGNRLFRNRGDGTFADITGRTGVAGAADAWSTSACFFDFDNDGDLDLFVANYVKWSKDIDLGQAFQLTGVGRAYGPPISFPGTYPYLYRNDGGGVFVDVSEASGVQVDNPATGEPIAKSLGVVPIDVDRDGWMDLIVANDTVQNFLFHNRGPAAAADGSGRFEEIGTLAGVAFDMDGKARGAMGIDAAYYLNDDSLGVAIGNFANEMTALYVTQGANMQFADEAIATGLGPPTRAALSFGTLFVDVDLDGRLDLLSANGHIEEDIHVVQSSQQYRQPALLFWNCGADGANPFAAMTAAQCGQALFQPIVGRGAAYGDLDGDGDLDLVLTQIAGPPLVLRNDQALGHHYVRLKLVGTGANREAIGAWVEIQIGDRSLRRQVMPSRSYLAQVELPVTFGLGAAEQVDSTVVTWPDGSTQPVTNVRIDAETIVRQETP